MKDTLNIKVYNKTFVSIPQDTTHTVIMINNTTPSVSYRDQVWVGLGLLCIFILVFAFKKTLEYNNKTIHVSNPVAGVTQPTPPTTVTVVTKGQPMIDEPIIRPKIDMSSLGEINIKNEKM